MLFRMSINRNPQLTRNGAVIFTGKFFQLVVSGVVDLD
jgi:hypothetical protein